MTRRENAPYLRLLFWLKWKLQWRAYCRDRMALLGAVATAVFFVPLSIGSAIGCYFGFELLPPVMGEHLLGGVLLAIYLFWVLLPVFGYSVNESYDITRLFLYPLSPRRIFVGAVFGSLIDLWVMLAVPVLVVVVVICFTRSAASLLLALAALALFLFHTLALSQAILLAGAGMLRSRRFRDLMIVLVPLLCLGAYVGYHYFLSRMASPAAKTVWSGIMLHPAWGVVDLTPPGVAAQSVAAAGQGQHVLALGFLLILTAICVATVYLAGWLLELVSAGHVVSRAPRKPAAIRPAPTPAGTARRAWITLGTRLPPVIAAVIDKEIKYLFREPYFKSGLMGIAFMLVIGIFAFLQPWRPRGMSWFGHETMLWPVTGYVFFSEVGLLFNIFGSEGNAASLLFLFPSSRSQILIGKNLVICGALFLANVAVVAVLCAVVGSAHMFGPLLAWMEIATVVIVSVGNVVSILAPVGVVRRGWQIQPRSPGRGCGYGLLHLGFYLVAMVCVVPVLMAILAPTYWTAPVWFGLTIPLAVAYAVGAYIVSLRLAKRMLWEREFEVIHSLTQEGQ